jgi:hypothetical protein
MGIHDATIVSSAALVVNGLTTNFPNFLQLLATKKEASGLSQGPVEYVFIPNYNVYPDILVINRDRNVTAPNAERSIVEYYKDRDNCLLDDLYQACYSYHRIHGEDISKLEEIAIRAGLRPGEMTEFYNMAVEEVASDG